MKSKKISQNNAILLFLIAVVIGVFFYTQFFSHERKKVSIGENKPNNDLTIQTKPEGDQNQNSISVIPLSQSNTDPDFVSVPISSLGMSSAFLELREAVKQSPLAPLLQTDIREFSNAARFAAFFRDQATARDYVISTGFWSPNENVEPIIPAGSRLEVTRNDLYFYKPGVGRIEIQSFRSGAEELSYRTGPHTGKGNYIDIFRTSYSPNLKLEWTGNTEIKRGENFPYKITFNNLFSSSDLVEATLFLTEKESYYDPGLTCAVDDFYGNFGAVYQDMAIPLECYSLENNTIQPGTYYSILAVFVDSGDGINGYYNFGSPITILPD